MELSSRTHLAIHAIATTIAFVFVSNHYWSAVVEKVPMNWNFALLWELASWNIWALLFPSIMKFSRRFPFQRGSMAKAIAFHCLAGPCFAAVHFMIHLSTFWALNLGKNPFLYPPVFEPNLEMRVIYLWSWRLFLYFVMLIGVHAYDFYQRYRNEEIENSKMEGRLSEIKLQTLKMRLDPEFLFARLHAVSSLIDHDVEAADEMLAELGDMLRKKLQDLRLENAVMAGDVGVAKYYQDADRPSAQVARWVKIFGIWTLVAIYFACMDLVGWTKPAPNSFYITQLSWAYTWAAMTPFFLWVTGKYSIQRPALWRTLPVLFIINIGVWVILAGASSLAMSAFERPTLSLAAAFMMTASHYGASIVCLMYWAILTACYAYQYRQKIQEEVLRFSRVAADLAGAQLQALQMQLQPHFLFNTLNSIAELMHEDKDLAREMLRRLEHFLRLTLENADATEVTLQKELEFLKNYLEIQQIRFHDRLRIDLQIDPQVMSDTVPNLILQPIVENAIRHGIAARTNPGLIQIQAVRDHGKLRVQIRDDGPGLLSGREGLGLSNTRARLKKMYGPDHSFHLFNAREGGLTAVLEIPSAGRVV